MKFHLVSVNPHLYWFSGEHEYRDVWGWWNKDKVVVTADEAEAQRLAEENKRIGFLSVSTDTDAPNGFLVEADENKLKSLLRGRGRVNSVVTLWGHPLGLPNSFALVTEAEFRLLPKALQETAKPIRFEAVTV